MMNNNDFEDWIGEAVAAHNSKIKKILEEWCEEAHVDTPVGYYENSITKFIEIYTDHPGYLIGKGGCFVDKYTKILNKEFYHDYKIKFIEIRGGIVNYEKKK